MDVVSLLGVTGVVGTLMFAVREIRRRVKGGGGRRVTESPGQSNLVPESVYGEQGVRETLALSLLSRLCLPVHILFCS